MIAGSSEDGAPPPREPGGHGVYGFPAQGRE
jgi:hypothetical protein